MDKKKHAANLKVFGYGLALFIPLFVLLKHLDHHMHFGLFVLVLVGILFILSKVTKFLVPYFLILIGIWLGIIFAEHEPLPALAKVLLALSVVLLLITVAKPRLLEGFYTLWMKAAHAVSMVVTVVILTFLYYIVFGIAGLIIRLMRKDLLDRKMDRMIKSYWIERKEVSTKEDFRRQF